MLVDVSNRRTIRGRIWGSDSDRLKTPRLRLLSTPRRSGTEAGRTMDDAPEILMTGGCESIDGCVGPAELDHFFKLRLPDSGIFVAALTTGSSAPACSRWSLPRDRRQSASRILLHPAQQPSDDHSGARTQVYFVRVLHFFYENNPYSLTLTFQHSRASNGQGLESCPSGRTRQSRRPKVRRHSSARRLVRWG